MELLLHNEPRSWLARGAQSKKKLLDAFLLYAAAIRMYIFLIYFFCILVAFSCKERSGIMSSVQYYYSIVSLKMKLMVFTFLY